MISAPLVVLKARQTRTLIEFLMKRTDAVAHRDVDSRVVPAPRGVVVGEGRRRTRAGWVRGLVDAVVRAEEHVGKRAVRREKCFERGGVAPPGKPPQVLSLADDDLRCEHRIAQAVEKAVEPDRRLSGLIVIAFGRADVDEGGSRELDALKVILAHDRVTEIDRIVLRRASKGDSVGRGRDWSIGLVARAEIRADER